MKTHKVFGLLVSLVGLWVLRVLYVHLQYFS